MGLLKRKKTVADFVNGLQLDKHDHQRLIEHIQEHASAAVGPSLDSPCNQHFRYRKPNQCSLQCVML